MAVGKTFRTSHRNLGIIIKQRFVSHMGSGEQMEGGESKVTNEVTGKVYPCVKKKTLHLPMKMIRRLQNKQVSH